MIRVMTEKGLSGNALKVIAIVAMTIDHLAWVGIETYEQNRRDGYLFRVLLNSKITYRPHCPGTGGGAFNISYF